MTTDLSKLNKEVQTRFELLTQADMVQLDEATTKAKAEGKLEQRHSSEAVVRKYTQDIVNGDWQLNPQPLVITTEGWLLDGWHRVKAGIRSGQSIVFNVTRKWPTHATFKVVDTGKGRSTGQLLSMQGMTSTAGKLGVINSLAAICSEYGGSNARRGLSIAEVERILSLFRRSFDAIWELREKASTRGNPSPITASMIFMHDKLGEPIYNFAEDFYTLRFSEDHPARALKRWVEMRQNKEIRVAGIRVTMNALFAYTEKLPMSKVHSSQTGLEWARKLQAKRVEEVRAIVGAK